MDEELLRRLDATPEAREEGRSAVLRRATEEYLIRRERALIRERYAAAYGEARGLDPEFEGWEDEGQWPSD